MNETEQGNEEEEPKAKRRTVKVEELFDEDRWEEAHKRLALLKSPKRIGQLLYYIADDKEVPGKIVRTLFAKLKGKREHSVDKSKHSINDRFWLVVCNHSIKPGRYGLRDYGDMNFDRVCLRCSVSSLGIFLKEYTSVVGLMCTSKARSIICDLWRYVLLGRETRDSQCQCPAEKEEELLKATSRQKVGANYKLRWLWRKTEYLIKATLVGGNSKVSFIHTLLKYRMPRVIIWFAMRLYPEQLKEKDKQGRLPLHVAASINDEADLDLNLRIKFKFFEIAGSQSKRIVELVLEAFPAGAKCADSKDLLPAEILLNVEYTTWTDKQWTQRCVQALIRQAPEVLHKKNTENRMLPFMVGAAIHENNTYNASSHHHMNRMLSRKLNLTFWMIREDPTVLSSARGESTKEKYLRSVLHKTQEQLQEAREQLNEAQERIKRLETDLYGRNPRPTKQARVEDEGNSEIGNTVGSASKVSAKGYMPCGDSANVEIEGVPDEDKIDAKPFSAPGLSGGDIAPQEEYQGIALGTTEAERECPGVGMGMETSSESFAHASGDDAKNKEPTKPQAKDSSDSDMSKVDDEIKPIDNSQKRGIDEAVDASAVVSSATECDRHLDSSQLNVIGWAYASDENEVLWGKNCVLCFKTMDQIGKLTDENPVYACRGNNTGDCDYCVCITCFQGSFGKQRKRVRRKPDN